MHTKFIVVWFVLSLASCKCGLLNWFNEWNDALNTQDDDTKCRERRDAEQTETAPEITDAATDRIVSLMDIEEGNPTAETEHETKTTTQGYSKAKRCPRGGFVGSMPSPVLTMSRMKLDPLQLSKRQLGDRNRNMCTTCIEQNCNQCNRYCKNLPTFANNITMPWDNQKVGLANRMGQPKTENTFSKTFREGDTKDIICRIIGITDVSDIDTVTVLVTTFSNKPPMAPGGIGEFTNNDPRRQENLPEQKLGQAEPKQINHNELPNAGPAKSSTDTDDKQSTQPDVKPRFNDFDDDEDPAFPRMQVNEGNLKENPDLIEGPPPFLRNNANADILPLTETPLPALDRKGNTEDGIIGAPNKEIIVQPKEFQSDESDENKPLLPVNPEESTLKPVTKPSLLSRLRELTTPRTNTLSALKNLRKLDQNKPKTPGSKGGFLQNLLKSRQRPTDNSENILTPVPLAPDSVPNMVRNTDNPAASAGTLPTSIQLPEKPSDKISEITEALQEVKAMVKNIQQEAQKASDKRLLGAPNSGNILEGEKITNPVNHIHPSVPPQVVDNFKKVNKYLVNRAQDALDTIGHPEKNEAAQVPKPDLTENLHSDITKKIITDFKKMPQFLLDKVKDTLDELDGKPKLNLPSLAEPGTETVGQANKQIELPQRFGGDDENTETTQNSGINDATGAKIDDPTTKPFKTKLEKYLADLKEKRKNMYSPEKFLKLGRTKGDKVSTNTEGLPAEKISESAPQTSTLKTTPYDLEKQRELLRGKLKKYIDGIKTKKVIPPPTLKPFDETTTGISRPLANIGQQTTNPNFLEPQSPPRFTELTKQPPLAPVVNNEDIRQRSGFPLSLPAQNPEQVVGEPNPTDVGSNNINHFLPTIPTTPQVTAKPSKLMKYLEDLRAKRPLVSTPKSVLTPLETTTNQILNPNDSKKDLLKDKVKQYVKNLRKPSEARDAKPESITLTPRGPEELSKFNRQGIAKPKSIIDTSPQDTKKDLLKDKIRNYVNSLKKPMESRMSQPSEGKKFPQLTLKSPEAQREELNALKRKLDNLLKERVARPKASRLNPLSTDPVIGETQPNPESQTLPTSNGAIPIPNGADDLQNVGLRSGDVKNDETVGSLDNPDKQTNGLLDEQGMNNQDPNLQSRSSFTDLEDILESTNNLGKIVQSSSEPKDIFFIGSGIKLPLQIKQGKNGSMDLSVDLEKLCSCQNSLCPKNHTAIEETVGAILEKEAELKDQLQHPSEGSSNDVKIELVPHARSSGHFSNFRQRFADMNKQRGKTNIFKRSSDSGGFNPELTTFRNVLESLKKENNNRIRENTAKNLVLPKLPTFEEVANELANFGKKLHKSFVNTVNNVQELHKEVAGTLGSVPTDPSNPEILKDSIETNLKKIKDKTEELNNDILRRLKQENNINKLKSNGINFPKNNLDVNEYIKNLERQKTLRKLLQQLNLPQATSESVLRQIEDEANSIIKNLSPQNSVDKLLKKASVNKFEFPKIPTNQNPLEIANQLRQNLKNNLPNIPKIQNQLAYDMNDNLAKISDAYESTKINALENKLKQLDNKVEKYEEANEKLFVGESEKFFGGRRNEVVEKELDIVGKVLSWLSSFSKSES